MRWPKEVRNFVFNNYKGIGPKQMTEIVNKKFGLNMTRIQMKSLYRNNRLNSGLTGRFPKGHVPACKGKKYPGKINSGCFKKGNMPKNYKPIGTERINVYGYVEIKVEDPNKWIPKHHYIWEKHYGSVPKGSIVVFLDGNPQHVEIENLELLSREELLTMNRSGLKFEVQELSKLGILVAKIKIQAKKRGREYERKQNTNDRN